MMPFIPTTETFLSLALCGSIVDKIVPPPILADYLLYHLNLVNPGLYTAAYDMEPTNDVMEFLTCIAGKTGKLRSGGYVDEIGAAMEAITRFRNGKLGQWSVDRITPDAFDLRIREEVMARQREFKGSSSLIRNTKSGESNVNQPTLLIVRGYFAESRACERETILTKSGSK